MNYQEAKDKYQINKDKTAFNLVEIEKKQMARLIELTPKVIELLEKFEGKVYNVRFEKALKEIDKNLSVDWRYSTFYIDYIDWNNRSTKDLTSDCGWVYINPREYHIVCTDSKEIVGNQKRIHLTDKAREDFQRWLDGNKETLEQMNSLTPEKIDGWRNRLVEIKAQIEELYNEVPYFCRGYFDLKTYAQWS